MKILLKAQASFYLFFLSLSPLQSSTWPPAEWCLPHGAGCSREGRLCGTKVTGVRGGQVQVWVPVASSERRGQAVGRKLWSLRGSDTRAPRELQFSVAKPSAFISTSARMRRAECLVGDFGERRVGPCRSSGFLKRWCGSLDRKDALVIQTCPLEICHLGFNSLLCSYIPSHIFPYFFSILKQREKHLLFSPGFALICL